MLLEPDSPKNAPNQDPNQANGKHKDSHHHHKHQNELDDFYARRHVADIRFEDINEDIKQLARSASTLDSWAWCFYRLLLCKYFLDIPLDGWIVYQLFSDHQINYAIAYTGVALISLVLAMIEIRHSNKIRSSGDVSDIYEHRLAKRMTAAFSFERWYFFREIARNMRYSDRALVYLYLSLNEWKRLFLVDAPEIVILILRISGHNCITTTTYNVSPCPSTIEWISIVLKIIQQTEWALTISIALLLYPCVRTVIFCRSKHWKLSFAEYCTYKIDKRINKLLTAKGLYHGGAIALA